jgi:hypothetical protein
VNILSNEESTFLQTIAEKDPQVVMFGEFHGDGYPYETFIARMLCHLRERYSHLALELYPSDMPALVTYFANGDYGQLKANLQQSTGWAIGADALIDRRINGLGYMNIAKRWYQSGGQLLLVQSKDPGRDIFMQEQISTVLTTKGAGVVAWLGLMHCCKSIGVKEPNDFEILRYAPAAQLLVAAGSRVFSVAHVRGASKPKDDLPALVCPVPNLLRQLKISEHITEEEGILPEFKPQYLGVFACGFDALYFDDGVSFDPEPYFPFESYAFS